MRKLSVAIALGFMFALVACGGGGGSSQTGNNGPTLSSIQVSGLGTSIIAGQNQQLTATASYSDGSTKDVTSSASWSSSDANIATVGAGGVLTAKASGQCSVSAKIGATGGSLSVTVTPALVSIAVTPANPSIAASTREQFIATGTYSDNSTQNLTSQVTWASSNTAVATVSTTAPTKGLASALSAGTATISATLGAVSGSTQLTVTSATVTQITVTAQSSTLTIGLTQQYTATGSFSDGTKQDITDVVQWQSSNSNVASITVSGLATALRILNGAPTPITISASFGGVSGGTSLTVNAANVSSITIKPASGSIAPGTQIAFTATGTYTDGSTHDLTHVVTWSSDNTAVLKIGSVSGAGSGMAPGQANVTATLGSLSQTVPCTVTSATITSITVTPAGSTIPTGGRGVFSATGTFSDSTMQDISGVVSWSSDNTAVATIGASSGVALGVSAGTANITATFSYGGQNTTGSTQLNVSTATLQSITMNPSTAVLAPGSAVGIAANGNFSNGTTQMGQWINPLCTWTSSDNTVATVSPNGLVSGQSAGVVTITAQDGSVSASASVLVESAALSSIQIAPATKNVPVGFWTPFSAIGTFTNGDKQDLTTFVTWTSSNPSFATISNAVSTAGEATGAQPGTTTITAVFSGKTGTATLTVTNATLSSITLTPSNASITPGTTQSFTASGAFSDGSSMDVTRQVTWSSSTPSVATISSPGIAQGVASGTTTISASADNVKGNAVLNVQ